MSHFRIDRTPGLAKAFHMKTASALFALFVLASLALPSSLQAQDGGLFRHFVSFQFKEDTGKEKIAELVKAFLELKEEIDVIVDLEWGESENIEPRNDGFTHSFLVTFRNREGLATYLPHPAHRALVESVKPHLAKSYVFDYTAKP